MEFNVEKRVIYWISDDSKIVLTFQKKDDKIKKTVLFTSDNEREVIVHIDVLEKMDQELRS